MWESEGDARPEPVPGDPQSADGDPGEILGALLEEAPIGFASFDTQMRFRRVNRTLAEINGLPVGEHLGRRFDELFPDVPEEAYLPMFLQVLATGTPVNDVEIDTPAPGEPGVMRHWLEHWYPLKDATGRITGVGAIAIDITERRRAESRLELVAAIGDAMDVALGVEERLERLTQAFVPAIADVCVVDLVDDVGAIRRTAVSHIEPGAIAVVREMPFEAENPVLEVIRTGEPVLLRDVPAEMIARLPEHERRALDLTSAMMVPLTARGRRLGVLSLAITKARSGRRYGEKDLALATDGARRAALAIDNARLFERQREVARILQQGLAPAALKRVDGLDVAVSYLAAGDGIEIGGDFYDLLDDRHGGIVAVVGDVCGRGIEAASVSALSRTTLRALARFADDPASLMRMLNAELIDQMAGETIFIASTCLRLAHGPAGWRLQAVNAGGEPALLVREGTVRSLGRPGTFLGLFPEVRLSSGDIDLLPDDVLVLFTDGLTEARGVGGLLGSDGVTAHLMNVTGKDARGVCDALGAAAAEWTGGIQSDDVSVLVIRIAAAREQVSPLDHA